MDDEKLIECVRNHEELYNLTHPQYLSASLKVKMWDEIANQLDQPAAVCKTRWNNIRDNFRKSLKKRITKSRRSSKFNKYKYEDQLSFLTPFIKERETLSSFCSTERTTGDETDSNCEENDEDFEENDEVKPSKLKSVESVLETRSSSQNVEDSVSTENVVSARSNQFIKRKRVEKTQPKLRNPITTSPNLMNKYTPDQQTFHPVDAFLIGLAPTLKSFSSYHLNIAKSKIFNIVQEIEMSEIMQERYGTHPEIILSSPSPCPSPIPLSIPSPLPISPTTNDSKNAWPCQDSRSSTFHQQTNDMNQSSFD